ncbi:hypothetical protein ACIU1J_17490 [Azospirillum doebereinerae]|uniref:hypothetical protein n=1 Tax=Azospirillum doebereinerae TaxID=92933 RepID=UPI00384DA8CC
MELAGVGLVALSQGHRQHRVGGRVAGVQPDGVARLGLGLRQPRGPQKLPGQIQRRVQVVGPQVADALKNGDGGLGRTGNLQQAGEDGQGVGMGRRLVQDFQAQPAGGGGVATVEGVRRALRPRFDPVQRRSGRRLDRRRPAATDRAQPAAAAATVVRKRRHRRAFRC